MKIKAILLIAVMGAFINSCRRDEVCDRSCSGPCRYLDEKRCECVNDTANFHCPPGAHGWYYDYYTCSCICKRGWTGALCDQRDTNYYVSFYFGTDTANLGGPIRTSVFSLSLDTSKFFDFTGAFPPGSEIDTVTLIFDTTSTPGPKPFCEADSCHRLEILLQSGDTATAFSGNLYLHLNSVLDLEGTFEADIHTLSGDKYFIREGTCYLSLE